MKDGARVQVVRAARRTIGMGAFAAGSLFGSKHTRFLGLRSAAEIAIAAGDLRGAEELAQELLALAESFKADWYYGNALHHGHQILGAVYLKRGDVAKAERELLESARTTGSPQLNSFGPSMTLARDLLDLGRSETVLEFFRLCRAFWCPEDSSPNASRLNEWTEAVERGEVPDFGPNLVY